MADRNDTSLRARAGRAINDLVMAELFLVQATIESASALGESFDELRDLYQDEAGSDREQLSDLLKRSRDRITEPYSTRLSYLRDIMREDMAA